MPINVVKTSVTIDSDLIAAARQKSRRFNRFGKENLSGYINSLIRKDLGMIQDPSLDSSVDDPPAAQPKRKAAS